VFLNFLIPTPPFHSWHIVFAPSLIKQTQGSKFTEFYLKKVSNSWTKQLLYDTDITFRILVKIIHTVAGHIDDPGEKFKEKIALGYWR